MKRLLYFLFIFVLIISCSRTDKKKKIITNFDTIFIDSLIPYKNKMLGYAMQNTYIKGYTNDSIQIRFSLDEHDETYSFYFKDSIDTRLYFDYYGGSKRYFYFNPYKATKGKLEIKYSLD